MLGRAFVSVPELYIALQRSQQLVAQWAIEATLKVDQMLTAQALLGRARAFCVRAIREGEISREDSASEVGEILEALAESRISCFHFEPDDETYNFHVFRWDVEAQLLKPYARTAGPSVVINNREWRMGQGHAGACMEVASVIALDDLQGTAGQGYRRQEAPTDSAIYRSILDAPIMLQDRPWGVVSITSGAARSIR